MTIFKRKYFKLNYIHRILYEGYVVGLTGVMHGTFNRHEWWNNLLSKYSLVCLKMVVRPKHVADNLTKIK
jgi:hypothetical protein